MLIIMIIIAIKITILDVNVPGDNRTGEKENEKFEK
mgnify:CR=1 FL=1